jgi:hypothetical protein
MPEKRKLNEKRLDPARLANAVQNVAFYRSEKKKNVNYFIAVLNLE